MTEEPGGLMSMGCKESDTTEPQTHTHHSCYNKFVSFASVSFQLYSVQNNLKGFFVLRLLGPTPRVADSYRSGAQHENVQSQQVSR